MKLYCSAFLLFCMVLPTAGNADSGNFYAEVFYGHKSGGFENHADLAFLLRTYADKHLRNENPQLRVFCSATTDRLIEGASDRSIVGAYEVPIDPNPKSVVISERCNNSAILIGPYGDAAKAKKQGEDIAQRVALHTYFGVVWTCKGAKCTEVQHFPN